MSKKGYEFESQTEQLFLDLTEQKRSEPLLVFNAKGELVVNRSFRVPSSGAMESIKGDIITAIPWLPRQLKVECKARYTQLKTRGAVINFEREWITKHLEEAIADHQLPVWTFSFKGAREGRVWFLIKEGDYTELTGKPTVDMGLPNQPKVLLVKSISVDIGDRVLQFVLNSLLIETMQGQFPGRFIFSGDKYLLIPRDIFVQELLQLREKGIKIP